MHLKTAYVILRRYELRFFAQDVSDRIEVSIANFGEEFLGGVELDLLRVRGRLPRGAGVELLRWKSGKS